MDFSNIYHNLVKPCISLCAISWDVTAGQCVVMSAQPHSTRLTGCHSVLFVFSFSSTCAWPSHSSENDSAAISAEEQRTLGQSFPDAALGTVHVEAGRSLYINKGQRLCCITSGAVAGRILQQNQVFFFFCVYLYSACIHPLPCLSRGIASSIYSCWDICSVSI